MLQPWKLLGSRPLGDFRIFTIRADTKVSPRTGLPHDFYILDCPNWVNVVAVTPAQELIMVEQFRHGSNTFELEIPGGMIDPHETDPVAAGLRELREETGYEGENARQLARVHANPAIQSNTCYTVFVENCHVKHALKFDSGEDIITKLVPLADIPRLIAEEKILHPLVIVALYRYELWRRLGK